MENVRKMGSLNAVFKFFMGTLMLFTVFYVGDAFAADGAKDLGGIAEQITSSFEGIGKLILGIAFVAGLGFTMASIFKFKQHKDNPTQIPLGTPIALLAVGVALIFLPNIIAPAGQTIFGKEVKAGGFQGDTSELPQ